MLKTTTILGLTATLLLMTTAGAQALEPQATQALSGVERPREARQGRGQLGVELRERVRERLERADGQGRRGRMQGRRGDEAKRLGHRGLEHHSGRRNEGRSFGQSRGRRNEGGGFRQSRSERSEFGGRVSSRAKRGEFRQRNKAGQRGSRPERGFGQRSGIDQRASLRQELAELKALRRELKQRIAELKARAGKQGHGQSEGRGQRSQRSFRR